MVRQTGNTQFDETGILVRGTVVRHLILPDNLAGTDKILENIAKISKKLPLNLMDQYHPSMYRGYFPSLKKRVSHGEYLKWVEEAKKKGLNLVN
jgi:putative pyruvate formate lyase activating enzyme